MTNLDLIQSFKQGNVNLESNSSLGNCASIAIIKASIEVFGINNVFELTNNNGDYTAKLKNGAITNFTQNQLNRSNEVIGFELNTSNPEKIELYTKIFNYSRIIMCVMTVRVMKIGESGQGIGNYEEALKALNDGAFTPNLPKILGIEEYCSKPTLFLRKKHSGMLGWLRGHTVYISKKKYDLYGTPKKSCYKYPKRIRIYKTKQR